jgi:Rhodopirellula transposase DDE domain
VSYEIARLSVDTKKKELIGNYKNPGSDYRPRARPDEVNVHDFPDKELGKAIPYGVYDRLYHHAVGGAGGPPVEGSGFGLGHIESDRASLVVRTGKWRPQGIHHIRRAPLME